MSAEGALEQALLEAIIAHAREDYRDYASVTDIGRAISRRLYEAPGRALELMRVGSHDSPVTTLVIGWESSMDGAAIRAASRELAQELSLRFDGSTVHVQTRGTLSPAAVPAVGSAEHNPAGRGHGDQA